MTSFASACDLYETYKSVKQSISVAESNYNTAVSNNDSSSASKYSAEVSELKTITSQAYENSGFVIAEFNLGVDVNDKATEVKTKLDSLISEFPQDMDQPVVEKLNPLQESVVDIVLRGADARDLEEYVDDILEKLVQLGCNNIIFTGIAYSPDTTGVVVYENGQYSYYKHSKLSNSCHGTGDIYASAFVGALVRGKSAYDAAKIAADYTVECIKATAEEENHWYGAKFEPVLMKLIQAINE